MAGMWPRKMGGPLGLSFALIVAITGHADAGTTRMLQFKVHDYVGLAKGDLVEAMKTATAVYAADRVEVRWTYRCFQRCRRSVDFPAVLLPRDAISLTINVYPDSMTPTTFPKSVMGSAPSGSFVAYAFFGRVTDFALRRKLAVGTVLGHIIAHEVGHLLLREGHVERGLMRGEWLREDLVLAKRGQLCFTAEQGARLRAYLAQSAE